MKYIKKIPKENAPKTEQLLSSGWKKLKEPRSIGISIAASLPIGILLMFAYLAFISCIFTPLHNILYNKSDLLFEIKINFLTLFYLIFIVLFVWVHEWIHGLLTPDFLRSSKAFWGFNGLYGFMYTEEIISKTRFIIVSIMPLIFLSIIFQVIMYFAGWLNGFIVFLGLLNAGGSCVDILNIILVSVQVPKNGLIINNGMSTYYKKA